MIWALIVGLFVGALAKFLMPGRDPSGIIVTSLIGIAGALLAHWIGVSSGWYLEGEPAGFFASVVGAMLVLFLFRMVRNPRTN